MAQSPAFIALVAGVFINTLSYCHAENMYCVTPTIASCSSCPQNSTNCTTLSDYAQEAKLYFTSNTTMVFLPGDHTLDTNITVVNVSTLTMHAESSSGNRATFFCNGSVGLSLVSMVDLKIRSLAFKFCGRSSSVPLVSNYGLLLQSSQNAELVDCSFHDNLGAALVVDNTTVTLAGNSEFTHNYCESISGSNSCVGGGGIYALSSYLTFTGNTTFNQNHAYSYGGGAIYASHNTVISFNGTSNFISNLARDGGAIYASYNTVLSFSGTSNFISNLARDGGAIYTSYNTVLSFNGTSSFINNSVQFAGGAIHTSSNTVLSFNGTANFISNSASAGGGAIYTVEYTRLSFNGTSNFINNSVYFGGGAIYASNNTLLSFNGNCGIPYRARRI